MAKIRPNDPCPCNSGKKYKKCCFNTKNAVEAPRKRGTKTEKEIEGIRKACSFNAQLMEYIKPLVVEGISTNKIDTLVADYTAQHGHIAACLNYHGFPKSLCTSINNVVCHGIPSDEDILKNGDIINIDLTTIVDGYFGDQSETLFIGDVSDEAKKVTECSRIALDKGIEAVQPGVRLYDVSGAIEDYVHSCGFSVVREYTGHGIGIEFHEPPQVPHYRTRDTKSIILEPGMTFTIEPMVNVGDWRTITLDDGWTAVTKDGSLSAQFEHTLLVTQKGVDILTDTSKVKAQKTV
jgi:methionyl aminopeptidase